MISEYENVNAIEFFHESKFADIYIRGDRRRIQNVINVTWIPYIHPKPEEQLPVVLFKSDTLSTSIHFSPFVKVRYDSIRMELAILWSLTV